MTNLSNLVILSSYGDLITTTNGGQGLSTVLEYLQDGLGHSSPLQLATNAFNIDRNVGTFQLDGTAVTAQAIYINEVCEPDATMPGTGGLVVPSGTTGQRNPRNGTIRYNTTTAEMEYYVNNAWITVSGTGDVTGPGSSIAFDIPIFADTTGKLLIDSGVQVGGPPLPGMRAPRDPLTGTQYLLNVDGIDFVPPGLITVDGLDVGVIYKNTPGHCPVSVVISDVAGVNTTNSALLEIQSTTGAFLLSRMTTTQMNALLPANGMVIYNTTAGLVYAYQTGSWAPIGEGGSVTSVAAVSASPALVITGSPITSTGTFTFTLDPSLEGFYPLATDGILVRDGTGSYSTVTITGTANQITITHGDGTTGNPTIALASNITGITSATIGDLHFATNVISSVNSNENIVLTPNGTGIVTTAVATLGHLHFATNVISSTNSNENIVLTPNGTGIVTTSILQAGDLHFATNVISSTGSNENIVLTPSGTGIVTTASATIGDLNLASNTLSSVNSNENIIIEPNGTGVTQFTSEVDILSNKQLRFYATPNTFYVGLKAPALSSSSLYTFPSTYPSFAGQILSSDLSGNLSWVTNSGAITNILGTPEQINVVNNGDTTFTISISDDVVLPGVQGMTVPAGTIGQRPFLPNEGMIRFNDTYGYLETFVLGADIGWQGIVTANQIQGGDGIFVLNNFLTGNITISFDPELLAQIAGYVASAETAAATAEGAAATATTAAASASASAIAAAASAAAAAVSAQTATEAVNIIEGAIDATYILQEATTALPNAQSLGTLTTGLLKDNVSGTTGILSIAIPGVDYYSPGHPTTIIDTGLNGNFFIGTNAGNGSLTGIDNVGTGYGVLFSETSGSRNTAYGYNALTANSSGADNTAVGYNALTVSATNSGLTAIGSQALAANSSGTGNQAIGFQALAANTTGSNNTASGYQALATTTTVSGLSAFGYQALTANSSGTGNSAFGHSSLALNTTGSNNIAFGNQTLAANVSGTGNSAFGYHVLQLNTGSFNTGVGYQALQANVSGTGLTAVGYSALTACTANVNTAVGYQALTACSSGANHTAMGYQALAAVTTVSALTAFGHQALTANTTGTQNAAFGTLALATLTSGSNNCSFGFQALTTANASSNSAFGNVALLHASSGGFNSAFGDSALTALTTGGFNCAFGYQTLQTVTTVSGLTAFGTQALGSNTSGTNNTACGFQALSSTNSGSFNSAMGYAALFANTTGNHNTASGYQALNNNIGGSDNTAYGYQAISNPTGISGLTAFGSQALKSITTGTANAAFGYQALTLNADGLNNSAFGYQAAQSMTSGASNSSFGYQSMNLMQTGGNNSAFGYQALQTGTNINYCSALGYQALSANTTSGLTAVGYQALSGNNSGSNNAALGYQALTSNTSGGNNTGLGYSASASMTSGSNNTAVGYNTGFVNTTYNQCTFLGASADASANNLTNATAIGYNASVATSNSMVLGAGANVGIGTSSPANILHIVGTYQQKGITSGYTGSDLIKGQANVQTTNNTITTILTIAIPTSPDTAVFVKADILCILSTGASAAYGQSFAAAWYNGTTSATISTAPTITMTNSGSFAVAAAWSVSGNNLLLRVTGIAASTINWVVNYEKFAVTTSTS